MATSIFLTTMDRSCVITECQQYRYQLNRIWDTGKGIVQWIGLNPSTADSIEDDPTMRRVINFTLRWGYGGLIMTNLFAFRTKSPKETKKATDPVGTHNDRYLTMTAKRASLIVAAGGGHGAHKGRDKQVLKLLRDALPHGTDIMCLGISPKTAQPEHPLFLPATREPIIYSLDTRTLFSDLSGR